MPELPEVFHIAKQMNTQLKGKSISEVEILQEKCLNIPVEEFIRKITNREIVQVSAKGKWLFIKLSGDIHLLISLGMGGDIIYHEAHTEFNQKHQFKFVFHDQSFMHVFFSWFGYVHLVDQSNMHDHTMTARLGICPLSNEFSFEKFQLMLKGRKGGIKSYLMDQHNIAGIGNVYIQDILFKARLHPNRIISQISEEEMLALYHAITSHLQYATSLGGLIYERDFYGQNGKYTFDLIGHRPGAPCPICKTLIKEIRTGSTRSFICEKCQN